MTAAVFQKEFKSFFSSATGYVVLGLFWVATGLFLWVIPGQWNVFQSGYAQLDGLFQLSPWLFMLLCPAITMRMIAEERQNHTWNWLRTLPIRTSRLVLGKYMAALLLGLIALLPCWLYYFTVSSIAQPAGNVDSGAFQGAMLGLLFLIAANTAIGLFASSLTRNQLTSFLVALVLCFMLFYGFDLLGSLLSDGSVSEAVRHLGFHAHYTSISRGVVDSRDLVYFLAVVCLFVGLTVLRADHRD